MKLSVMVSLIKYLYLLLGIPDQYQLKDGDICNIDVSVYHNGFHSDLNATYLVGNVDEQGVKLVKNARKCLDEAIKLGMENI